LLVPVAKTGINGLYKPGLKAFFPPVFIDCPFVKIIWAIVHMDFNITPPNSIDHLFGTWLNGIIKSEKVNIRVGI
jgi:hypothetical protein